MAKIGVLETDECVTARPRFYLDKSTVKSLVALKLAKYVGARLIRLVKSTIAQMRGFIDGPIGVGNLLPFAKAHNYGDKLHYEMPMAGDRTTFARHRRRQIHVSSRNLFAKQAIA